MLNISLEFKHVPLMINFSLLLSTALKFDYPQVIDTSYIFKYMDLPTGASPSLNNLCKVCIKRQCIFLVVKFLGNSPAGEVNVSAVSSPNRPSLSFSGF